MIGVLTKSDVSGNILGYDLGDKKNKDQKIQILASEGVFLDPEDVDRLNDNWTDDASKKEFKKLSREVANDLSQQFSVMASMSERVKFTTGHVALSFSPADAKLLAEKDEDFKIQIAKEYMEQMGITDTQWVFTWHLDTRCPHGHIAYNRVRSDGTVIDGKNERYRSQKVSEKISRKYGFALGGEVERNLDALCDKRKAYAQMRLLALEALSESCSIDEYEANLRRRGVELRASGGGYSYSTKSGKYPAKGSKLDRKALSYDAVTATIKQNLAARQAQKDADRQKAETEAKAAEKAAQDSVKQAQEEAARVAEERRLAAEAIAREPETFVIHHDMAASLYSSRPKAEHSAMAVIHEAIRAILKYRTWGADIRHEEPKEFIEKAVNGQLFGTVKIDAGKARIIGNELSGMIENPDEVIYFTDHKGQALDLFTTAFWDFWHQQLEAVRRNLSQRTETKQEAQVQEEKSPVVEKKPEKPAAKPKRKPGVVM